VAGAKAIHSILRVRPIGEVDTRTAMHLPIHSHIAGSEWRVSLNGVCDCVKDIQPKSHHDYRKHTLSSADIVAESLTVLADGESIPARD